MLMTVTSRRLLPLFALAVLTLVAAVAPARAQADADRAATFIDQVVGETMDTMTQDGMTPEQHEERFRDLFTAYIDLDFMGQFVTGRYWRKADDATQTEFLKLLEDVTVLTWASRIARYSDYEMTVVGPKETSSSDIFIETFFQKEDGPPVNFVWRLVPKDDAFQIRDMVIEGASMAITHRSEYQSVIRRGGGKLEALNEALRDMVARLREANGTAG